jgi:hypothetical protein
LLSHSIENFVPSVVGRPMTAFCSSCACALLHSPDDRTPSIVGGVLAGCTVSLGT